MWIQVYEANSFWNAYPLGHVFYRPESASICYQPTSKQTAIFPEPEGIENLNL